MGAGSAPQHVREEPQPPSVFNPGITPEMDAMAYADAPRRPDIAT
ncbi:hypothetical protein ACWER6_24135 [Streptomyces sp. NPDC004009]